VILPISREAGIEEPLLTIALAGEVVVTVGRSQPPVSFEVTRKVDPSSELVFSTCDDDWVHRFGELSGWAHFSFRVQAENILRADCFITDKEKLDPDALLRGHGSGIRFQPLALEGSPVAPEDLVGAGAFARGLHSRGSITPGWYRLSVECDDCLESFHLQSFHAGMMEVDYMYSDSGVHTLIIEPDEAAGPPDLAGMTDEARRRFEDDLPPAPDGTRYRYYNPLRCPHCRAPFLDYQKFPEDRRDDYYGHSNFGTRGSVFRLADPGTSHLGEQRV
jgi:hypothetical protein